ncbi:MAG: T9SS type A sorting domain-containing protein [Bacteroidales bacterium]|nr:T9SS type A sorting domain-containing protein [Bacteroidales bacterium]
MKRTLTLLITLVALISCAKAQTPGENFDVTHYEVRLWDFDFTNHTLQGEAFIDITVTAPTDTFVLELKSLTVTDAATETYDVTSFQQEGDFLTIVIEETASAGETLTLDVRYGGNTFSETWGGVEWWGDYVYNLGVGFDSQPHNLGKTWFPCVDNFTDKATYSLYITVTNDKKAICGGNLVNNFNNGDGTSTWHWEIPQVVATYHPSFAIGDYVAWTDTYNGIERDIPIEVYVKPNQINSVPGTFVHIKEIASFYEETFGPYPFNRIGYVCTGKGCMEHIDNIAITPGIITGNTTQEEYLAHELSHMYFGNKVTCSTAGDMWLNEGFAQFCGAFYRVGVYGEDDFQETISNLTNSIASWCKNEANWIPLNNMPLDMTYDGTAIYDRGAVIVNTMMNYMGRENFLNGIRHYLDLYDYGAATSEQLRDALTEATGIDMNGFFDNYVFIGGIPHYNVDLLNVTPNGTQYDAQIKISYWHVGPSHMGMNNRVEVTFVGADGQLYTEMAAWDGMEDEQTFSLDFEPIAAFVDYYNHFLDAKLDKNLTATASASLTQGKFKAIVNSVTDSTMLHLEDHFVGPDNDPEIPYLTLSTSHFWNFFRNDFGDADVSAQITFSNSNGVDGDIIHTENDSAVLLYRTNVNEQWHTIPYTQEGNWKMGRFTVTNPQSGQYTIGVIDKTLMDVNENTEPSWRVYPNPTNGVIRIPNGEYRITNIMGQTLKTGHVETSYYGVSTIDVSHLAPGTYFISINNKTQKFVIQ